MGDTTTKVTLTAKMACGVCHTRPEQPDKDNLRKDGYQAFSEEVVTGKALKAICVGCHNLISGEQKKVTDAPLALNDSGNFLQRESSKIMLCNTCHDKERTPPFEGAKLGYRWVNMSPDPKSAWLSARHLYVVADLVRAGVQVTIPAKK